MPILRGEHAPAPSRLVAEGLFGVLPASRKMVVRGAGHMGPLTHASVVSRLIVRHTVASRREKARCVQSHRNSLRCLTPEQVRSAVNDPGCVKTHTVAKCRKTILQQGIEHCARSIIRLHDAQFLRNGSTCAAGAGVFAQPRPSRDMHQRLNPIDYLRLARSRTRP